MEINKIYQGNALDVLKTFPDESIDTIITSPPYWGLRSYGEQNELIWDEDPFCQHSWTEQTSSLVHENRNNLKGTQEEVYNQTGTVYIKKYDDKNYSVCKKCNAWKGQLGLEPHFNLFIKHLCDIFDEIKRVLKKEGTCFVNLGDTYSSSGGESRHKGYSDPKYPNGRNGEYTEPASYPQKGALPKSLCQIPSRFAIEMCNRGWILRNELLWIKQVLNWKTKESWGASMPSPVQDRLNINNEKIFFFTKSQRYFFDLNVIRVPSKEISINRTKRRWEGHREQMSTYQNMDIKKMCHPNGKNPGNCIMFPLEPSKQEHYAAYPTSLPDFCITVGCPQFVCKDCGTPRERILKEINTLESTADGITKGTINLNDKPYAVQERKGFIAFRDLPPLNELKNYLNKWRKLKKISIDNVEKIIGTQAPHHWFTGESYPSKEDWITLKDILQFDDTFDYKLTKEYLKPAEKMSSIKIEKGYTDCGCNSGFNQGVVLDPFFGSGTTGLVALKNNRNFVGIELNEKYCKISEKRLKKLLGQKKLC